MVWLLSLQAVALSAFSLAQGDQLLHGLAHGALIAPLAISALVLQNHRRLSSGIVAVGLITESALLVHVWHGVIEAHFMFFVMILVLALYEDWLPFLIATAYVVLHHGLTGVVSPEAVYNHADAVAHPWKWAVIHGLFVAAAGVASVLAWRLNENVRAESRRAYRLARDNEERFRGAFESAPIGMVMASVDPAEAGRFVKVNQAMCDFIGYSEAELLEMDFTSVCHPDDLDRSRESFERLLRGEIDRYQFEKRYVHASGRTIWGLRSVTLIRTSSGEPAYALGQIQDVTERRRVEQTLAHQAHTDELTGLRNRWGLVADLDNRILEARDDNPVVLFLFDLDGFKAYNDAFGHPAGDALLNQLGQRLAGAIGESAAAYRIGGDEFCVLGFPGADWNRLEKVVTEALSERGDGFVVTASRGSVRIPTEAQGAADALRLADQRMYAQKASGRTSAGRQSADVLLQTLSERNPALGVHLDEVTVLCEAVATRLGIPDQDVQPLLQAALLHDVGKAAIPDEVLNKPGPLDEAEWDLMRQHTVVGERILSAAPSLARAGKLVRWSHERFDGAGYPDGISGEQIPLGARIIAVCDSYDAMTSQRPYRDPRSRDEALTELQRCAGSQFDPDVVHCFVEELGGRDQRARDVVAELA